jgi:fatty acid CoA ligase FadD9
MIDKNTDISPKKRYFLRMQDLVKQDPQIKQLMPSESIRDAIFQPGLSYDRLIQTALDGYAERPALGERDYAIARDNATGQNLRKLLPSFSTITYAELHTRVQGLANAWRCNPQNRVAPGDFVCIFGFTSIDYVTVDLACVYAHAVSVPLQTTLAEADLMSILAYTNPAALVAGPGDLSIVVRLAVEHGSIPALVVMEYDERDDRERDQFEGAKAELDAAGVATKIVTIKALIEDGQSRAWEFLPPGPEGAERTVMLLHSSGSTGTPKGAIYPERAAKALWLTTRNQLPIIGVSYAPLNHLVGRTTISNVLSAGGTAYVTARADLSTLFEDIRLVRPTYLNLIPRICDLVYQNYQNEVLKRTKAGEGDKGTVGERVKAQMRSTFLGDRLLGAVITSAPASPVVKEFMRDCFDILLQDFYGTTESVAGLFVDGRVLRPRVKDYRLRDVPELGYSTKDKPYPRGEFCFKSEYSIKGYYKMPEASAALFDKDGYQCTGDIVEERAPDHVVIIDRRNDVQKLSHGEYVAVGPLGTVFEGGSAVIKQIYLYGNSLRAYLLAVVVPDRDVVTSLLGDNPGEAQLRALIRRELQTVGRNSQLRGFEVPRDFIIEWEPFSIENGLLSSVLKRKRPNLKRKYGEQLEALYEKLEQQQKQDLEALKDPHSSLTVLEKICALLAANLGLQEADIDPRRTYKELGGDSLGAVTFSIMMEEIFSVLIPADAILSPIGSPQAWAKAITSAQNPAGVCSPGFAAIHGKGAKKISGKDLNLECFLGPGVLTNAATESAGAVKTVLLTGANGYVSRFLTLEYLKKLADKGGKLICLVWAHDNEDAKRQLEAVFAGADPEMEALYRNLAAKHLEVLAGDISQPLCGLKQEAFDQLASRVDRIVHAAALVNHALAYEHFFGSNVVGTAEMIRLAVSKRKKPIDFLSTVAVRPFLKLTKGQGDTEQSPIKDSIVLAPGYAAGYGASKWAGEHLLGDAHRRFGLPVNIFRCDLILAHQKYSGQINKSDMFTRLVYSLIVTGIAPESFYIPQSDGSRSKAHYDGVPVDVVAAVVAGVSDDTAGALKVFNVRNYHDSDGVSLDSFVDWIRSAGYSLEQVSDYKDWVTRFEQKLANLPDDQRQNSFLDLMGAVRNPWPPKMIVQDSSQFQELVQGLPIGNVPHLSEAWVHKCLDDMRRLGLIGKPA